MDKLIKDEQELEKLDKEQIKNKLLLLYQEVINLSNIQWETWDNFVSIDIEKLDKEMLIQEIINMSNIIKAVNKSNVLGSGLGFNFYIKPRYDLNKNVLGTNIVIFDEQILSWNYRGMTKDIRIPHTWKNIIIDKGMFGRHVIYYNIYVKELKQIELNDVMKNNIRKLLFDMDNWSESDRNYIRKLWLKKYKQ